MALLDLPPSRPRGRAPLVDSFTIPEGMWFETRAEKKKPFFARWRMADGSKTGESFATESERIDFAIAWEKQRKLFGKAARFVDAARVAMWAEFEAIVGTGAHPLTVAREWVKLRGMSHDLPLVEAWGLFNADQELRKLSRDSHSHRRTHGQRLCKYFKGVLVGSVRAEGLDAWLAQLRDPDTGQPMSPKTKAHHLKTARHFFEWLKDRRKLEHNPALAVTPPEMTVTDAAGVVVHREINVLTLEDAQRLFAVNADHLCIGRLALEAFGGLRFTSAARLRAADIRWEECGIVMPGHQHKSGVRHFVDGWPANLWAWMKHAPAACWDLPGRIYTDLKREAFERAGLKPPEPEDDRAWSPEEAAQFEAMKNVLRHSFATYHLAAFKDPKLTAYLMTKTSLQSLNNDYRGRAAQAAGVGFFAIMPPEKK